MPNLVDVSKLTKEQKIKLLEKAKEKLGMSKLQEITDRSRKQIYLYLRGFDERGKELEIPQDVIEKVVNTLTLDEVYEVINGFNPREVTINDVIAVIAKAVQDPAFRNIFFMILEKEFGEYLKEHTQAYLVTKDDIELFEKIVKNEKSRNTAQDRISYLRRALADLDYELTPTKLKEYILDLSEENKGRAEHTAKALKLFIKEVVKHKSTAIARELYEAFKTPKVAPHYKQYIPDLATVKQIFNNINDLGVKAFFIILTETGLRVGEVLSLKLDQIDFEHRIIHISKINKTKRAYITFLHESTTKWLKEVYLPYREDFVRKYENSLRKLIEANPDQNIDIEAWKNKLFPFKEDNIRFEIKQAMKKVLGREFRLYDLRSFLASYMVKQGVSPLIINLLQGRAPPQQFQILQNHYFVISDIELQQYYEKYAPKLL